MTDKLSDRRHSAYRSMRPRYRAMGGLDAAVVLMSMAKNYRHCIAKIFTHVETLVGECRARSEHALEAWALRTQARIAAARPDAEPEVVEALARSVVEHAQSLGLRPLVAHVHADLAEASARSERDASATEHRACAEEIFEAIGMPRWLDRLRNPLAPST